MGHLADGKANAPCVSRKIGKSNLHKCDNSPPSLDLVGTNDYIADERLLCRLNGSSTSLSDCSSDISPFSSLEDTSHLGASLRNEINYDRQCSADVEGQEKRVRGGTKALSALTEYRRSLEL
eukprot:scaffold630_cov350-Pavlova_lutheri.AAC.10